MSNRQDSRQASQQEGDYQHMGSPVGEKRSAPETFEIEGGGTQTLKKGLLENSLLGEDDIENLKNSLREGEEEDDDADKVGFWLFTANLTTICGLGTGILTLPYVVASAGIINAIIWNVVVLTINGVCNCMFVYMAERYKATQIEDFLALLPKGHLWKHACSGAVWVTFFLMLVSYTKVAATAIQSILGLFGLAVGSWLGVMVAVGIFVPLCFVNQTVLGYCNTASIAINVLIVVLILANYFVEDKTRVTSVCMFGMGPGNWCCISCLCTAVNVQPVIVPMYRLLEDRTPQKFVKATIYSTVFLFILFTIFATSGYMTYGSSTKDNIIMNLPANGWHGIAANLGIAFVVCCCYPLMLMPMVEHLRDTQPKKHKIIAFALIGVSAITAYICVATDISLGVLGVICGVVSLFFFMGLFPGLLGWKLMRWNKIYMLLLVLFGTVATVFNLVYPDPKPEYANCMWDLISESERLAAEALIQAEQTPAIILPDGTHVNPDEHNAELENAEALAQGHSQAHAHGHSQGHSHGHSHGHSQGHSPAHAHGHSQGHVQTQSLQSSSTGSSSSGSGTHASSAHASGTHASHSSKEGSSKSSSGSKSSSN